MTTSAGPAASAAPPVLAEVVRSGFVESRHRGSLVVLGTDGRVEFAVGDVTAPMSSRSANKPLQATGMLGCGLDLSGELLALVSASHSGEDFHQEGVRRILAGAGLDVEALRCPPSLPSDKEAARAVIESGGEQTRIAMNCSGKHAGMLATCVAAGWPADTYIDPAHPLQMALAATVEEFTGEKIAHVAVDGCGAPMFVFSLTGLARAYRALMLSPEGSHARRVVDAVRAHPVWTSGTRRDEAALMAGVPGLFCKGGAEACYALALPDGRAVALKLEDGGQRARPVVMAGVLRELGIDAPVVEEQATADIHGGGGVVGVIRPTVHLPRA